jgi:hypothetical protein
MTSGIVTIGRVGFSRCDLRKVLFHRICVESGVSIRLIREEEYSRAEFLEL